MSCENCGINKAIVIRPKNGLKVCKECFFNLFENEIHDLITSSKMFKPKTRIGVGYSGGKDSTVLAYVLDKLNKKHNYCLDIILLCIDEGIKGYRDKSIETVTINQKILNLELNILSYEELFGFTMDKVVEKVGSKGNCMYCGTFRRQGLEEAAKRANVECIVTGHNADDMAETILLNFMRGDSIRMRQCTCSRTGGSGNNSNSISIPRCKPFKFSYQKEIVLYAYYKKLLYFSTECTYSPGSARGDVRLFINDLEKIKSFSINNLIKAGETFEGRASNSVGVYECIYCSQPTASASKTCKACIFIDQLKKL